MSIVNIYRGAFTGKFDTIHETEHRAIKEIVKDDLDNAVIYVDGFRKDKNYILKDDELCTIRLFPKDPVSIIVGSLLGLVVADRVVEALSGKGILGWIKYGLVKWLIGEPDSAQWPDPLQSIPQLRGARNQSGYDKPFPFVMGKHRFTPYYIGKPYTTIGGEDGEDQYFHALFILGYSKLEVTEIKLGEIDLCSNDEKVYDGSLTPDNDLFLDEEHPENDPKLELRQGANEVTLYPQKVYEEQLSIELMNVEGKDNHVTRFSAKNPQKVEIEFTFNGGLISYNDDGSKKDATVVVVAEWRESGADQWKSFGTLDVTRQKAKVMRFVLKREFSYSEIINVPGRTVELRIVRTTEDDPSDTRTSDTVYLSAIRTWCFDYAESTKPGVNTLISQVPMIAKDRDRTCRLGIELKADNRLSGMIDAINCIVQSCGRTWDGTSWTPDSLNADTPTQNPASIALKAMQSQMLGVNKYADNTNGTNDKIDLASFGAFYAWCNETVTEGGVSRKRFTCNGVLTAEKRLDELLDVIFMTGRGARILSGGKYGVLIDKPRMNPVTILNNQNVLEATNQKNFEDLPDGYRIKFIDETDGYQENELYAMRDGASKDDPDMVIENIEMPFVTNLNQVYNNGRYQYACRKLRPEIWHRKLSINGNLLTIGCLVEVQDDTILVGIGEGAEIKELVVSGNYITGIKTDGLFDVTDASKRYGVKIVQFDGANPHTIRTAELTIQQAGAYSDFVFKSHISMSESPLPGVGDIISFGIYDKITTDALCFGKKDNGDGTFDVTLVPYQEGVYTADSGTIPEFDSKITPPQELAGITEAPRDTVTREEAITISQNFGTPGPPATVYRVIPSATTIKRYNSGIIDPPEISCSQVSVTGSGLPAESNKTLKYITSDDDEETLYEGPVAVGDWDRIDFRLYDGDTLLAREDVPVLSDGPPATKYELLPSVPMIIKDASGAAKPSAITCSQQVITGANPPGSSDKTIKYITSANATETVYTAGSSIPVAWDWIEFVLYDGAAELDRERVFVLSEGEPARTHELQPSASVIKVHDGITEPYKISCSQVSITGSGLPIPSDKTLKYATSLDTEQPYTGEITVNPLWKWIEFILYDQDSDGKNVPLDRERVPVQKDGESPVYLDLVNQHITVRADEYGEPYGLPITTQAVLYNGNTPITYAAFKANVAARNIVHYPGSGGSIFDPMAGDFYPVRSIQWSVSRGNIDQNGIITIAELPEDEAEIEVSAFYDDVKYAATLTLVKVKDGESPVVIDIENENTSISCNSYGVPYPGELPLTTKAIFFKGTEKAAPFWFLNTPISGISITQDGTITITENAGLGRANNILVQAAYRGKTYTRMFTITKALEGFTATQYELIPSANTITRDAAGNNTPATISCGQQKTVGNNLPEPSDKRLVYITSASSIETDYTGPVTVGTLSWIKFLLYSGQTFLDGEHIPVVMDGAGGRGVTAVTEQYYLSTSASSQAGGSWIDNAPPAWAAGKYMWTRSKVTYTAGDPGYTTPYLVSGDIGAVDVEYAQNSSRTTAPTSGWTTTAPASVDGQYIWSRVKITRTDGSVSIQKAACITGDAGADAFYLDLTNENVSLAADSNGVVQDHAAITSQAILYKGASAVAASNVTWSINPAVTNVSVSAAGLVTLSAAFKPTIDRQEIVINAVYGGVTYKTSLNAYRIMAGGDGRGIASISYKWRVTTTATAPTAAWSDAGWLTTRPTMSATNKYMWYIERIVYTSGDPTDTIGPEAVYGDAAVIRYLLPGVDSVSRDKDGNPSVSTVTCAQKKKTGDTIADGDRYIYYAKSSATGKVKGASVTVGASDIWIEFYLHETDSAAGAVIDNERIPIVSDGFDGANTITVDIESENTTIRCDAYGVPYPDALPITIKARLFDGSDLASPAWSIPSAPSGVAIAGDGTITVAKNATLGYINRITVQAVYNGDTFTRTLTLGKTLDGESPVILDLMPPAYVVPCDYLGNPLQGLPATAKATLYKGTQEITAAMEIAEAAKEEIIHYPGSGNNIFDPMLGGLYPTLGYPVVWTLIGAPAGVTIDRYGLITVSGAAQLSDINSITVNAAYHGKDYPAIFGITKVRSGAPGGKGDQGDKGDKGDQGDQGDSANVPKYRGVTLVADTGNTGNITLKPPGGQAVMNDLDWILFMGTTTDSWTHARLHEWHKTGKYWVMLEPGKATLEYMEALKDITDGAPDGIFSKMFCQELFAQRAAIDTLQAQLIKIGDAIYGGDRYNPDGSDNNINMPGFWLGRNGQFKFDGGSIGELNGAIKNNAAFITNNNHGLYASNAPLGTLYNTLVSKGYTTPNSYIFCHGSYQNDQMLDFIKMVQFIRMGDGECYIYGYSVYTDDNRKGLVIPIIQSSIDNPDYPNILSSFNIVVL